MSDTLAASRRGQGLVAGVPDGLLTGIIEQLVAHLVGDVGEAQPFVRVAHREGLPAPGHPKARDEAPNGMCRLGREKPMW